MAVFRAEEEETVAAVRVAGAKVAAARAAEVRAEGGEVAAARAAVMGMATAAAVMG